MEVMLAPRKTKTCPKCYPFPGRMFWDPYQWEYVCINCGIHEPVKRIDNARAMLMAYKHTGSQAVVSARLNVPVRTVYAVVQRYGLPMGVVVVQFTMIGGVAAFLM